jgi:peroxiredoxin
MFTKMKIDGFLSFCATAGLCLVASTSSAQEKQVQRPMLPDDPAAAWSQVQEVHRALRPPDDWRPRQPSAEQITEFQNKVRELAVAYARKAREFVERFPTNEHVGDARITVVHALTHAVAAGDPTAEAEIHRYVAAVLADKSIPEDDRVGVLLYSGNADFMKKVGMRLFTEGLSKLHEEFEANSVESVRAALKQFPTNTLLYTGLVAMADRAKGERQKVMAGEIIQAPGAPAGAKTLAEHILKGTKPYQVGNPVDIRFTALDGRDVDLARLKGKVVLVEFWSTTCGPCIAEMPAVKTAYDKFHERGFEVVAISLDASEAALRRFIKEKELPWPQHFDGKGWENQFAVKFGVFAIPTMWLVDQRGNLRSASARGNLERHIAALLKEQDSPTLR